MEGFYTVREMTRRLGVEAHMLRYWEKELKLDIPRDSQGHRIYGEEEAQLLTQVSEYKKQGKPLRIIRSLIMLPGQEETEAVAPQLPSESFEIMKEPAAEAETEIVPSEEELKSQRTQELLSRMVTQAVRESTETMITEMKESILKELDYQFRLQAEREAELRREMAEGLEEHFRRMDVLLQNQRKGRGKKLWR